MLNLIASNCTNKAICFVRIKSYVVRIKPGVKIEANLREINACYFNLHLTL